jgi:dolichol-phosphate mannosyltransferase
MRNTCIIIPTYNERENIKHALLASYEHVPDAHVLVVDDNSPDGTAHVVRTMQKNLPRLSLLLREQNGGLGRAYCDGFKNVLDNDDVDVVVTMDADLSHDVAEVPHMLQLLERGYDVVIGSRYVSGGQTENWDWRRRLLSRSANLYARTILGIPIHDLTAGFYCFRKELLRAIDVNSIQSDGYAFQIELKCRFFRLGARMAEHPIVFHERREGKSKLDQRVVWEALWIPWRLRFGSL